VKLCKGLGYLHGCGADACVVVNTPRKSIYKYNMKPPQ
jgi:hypothetical protein